MYQRIMNSLDADILAEELKAKGMDKAVISRVKQLITILDRNYGQYRGNADMGGYILFFENIQTYRNYFEKVIDFYHLDKNMYEYSECIRNGQQSGTEWHEEMYLLSSDDALVFIYPCEIKSI